MDYLINLNTPNGGGLLDKFSKVTHLLEGVRMENFPYGEELKFLWVFVVNLRDLKDFNNAIKRFIERINEVSERCGAEYRKMVEIGLVTPYGKMEIQPVANMKNLKSLNPVFFKKIKPINILIEEAIRMMEERMKFYDICGIKYLKPILMIFTEDAKISETSFPRKFRSISKELCYVYCLGVGNINIRELSQNLGVSACKFGNTFERFFDGLADAIPERICRTVKRIRGA
jgi:uncharacterized protein YegL